MCQIVLLLDCYNYCVLNDHIGNNSLTPGRCGYNLAVYLGNSFHQLISWALPVKLVLQNVGKCYRTPLMSQYWFTLCRLTTSHTLSQCGLGSMSPYGVARPQWVNVWGICILVTSVICSIFSLTHDSVMCLICNTYLRAITTHAPSTYGFTALLLDPDWLYIHDDVIKWKHFPCDWPFVWGIHRTPVNFRTKGSDVLINKW